MEDDFDNFINFISNINFNSFYINDVCDINKITDKHIYNIMKNINMNKLLLHNEYFKFDNEIIILYKYISYNYYFEFFDIFDDTRNDGEIIYINKFNNMFNVLCDRNKNVPKKNYELYLCDINFIYNIKYL